MDSYMNHVGRGVEHAVLSPIDHLAEMINPNEVGSPHQRESRAKRIHPKCRRFHGIPKGDVPSNT